MRNLITIILLSIAFNLELSAQTIYARADGDWDNVNTWSTTDRTGATCSCVPDANDDVNIDGYDVDVTNANAVANSVEVTNVSVGGAVTFTIENGFSLTVDFDFALTANNNGDNVSLIVQDDGSSLDINDDFVIDVDAGERLTVTMTDSTFIDVADDVEIDHARATSEDVRLNIGSDDGNDNFHVSGDFILSKSNGQEFQINLSADGELNVDGDMTLTWTGVNGNDHDLWLNLSDSSSLIVDGSLGITMNETGNSGNDIRVNPDNTSRIEVGIDDGNLTESASITMTDGNEIDIEMDRDAVFTTYGDLSIVQAGDDDIFVHLNQNNDGSGNDAQLRIDGNFTIAQTDGDRIQIYAEDDADIDVGGLMNIQASGQDGNDDHTEIQLEDNATLDVDSVFIAFVTRTASANIDLIIDLNDNSSFSTGTQISDTTYLGLDDVRTIFVDMDDNALFTTSGQMRIESIDGDQNGDINLAVDGDAIWTINDNLIIDDDSDDGLFFRLNQNATGSVNDALVTISGDLLIDKTNNGDESDIRINRDADLNITGNFTLIHDAGNYVYVYLNEDNDGGDSDGQFTVGGDFTITKTDGDNLYIYPNQESNIDIDGDFVIASSNMDGNNDHHEIQMDGNSTIDVDGSFTYTLTRGGSANIDYVIDLNNSTTFNIGSTSADTFYVSQNNGRQLQFDFDNTSIANLAGKMALIQTNADTDDDLDIELDRDAQLIVGGSVLLDKDSGDDLLVHLNQNSDGATNDAQFTMTGAMNMNNAGDYTQVYLGRDAVMSINGDWDINHSGTNGVYIRTNIGNDGGGADAQLTVNGDLNVAKSDGDVFYLYADENSDIDINGRLEVMSTNVDGDDDHHEIQVRDDALIDIDNSLTIDVTRAAGDADINIIIDLENNGQLLVGSTTADTLGIVQNNGRDIIFELDGDGVLDVAGNVNIEQNGFDDVLIYQNVNAAGSAADVQFTIDGNLKVNKTDGDRLYLFAYENSDLDVAGDIELISANIDGNDDHIEVRIFDDAIVDADGSLTLSANRASSADIDLIINLDDNGQLMIGSTSADSLGIYLNNGRESRIELDRNSSMTVSGNVNLYHNGYDDVRLQLNTATNGSGSDAQLDIDGNLIVDKIDGDVFTFYAYHHSDINIDGNVLVNSSNIDGDDDHHYIRAYSESTVDVDGSFTVNMSRSAGPALVDFYFSVDDTAQFNIGTTTSDSLSIISSNGRSTDIDIDGDGVLNVTGNVRMENSGSDDISILLNQAIDGVANDADFDVGGKVNLVSTGDDIEIYLSRDAIWDITGDLDVNFNGTDDFRLRVSRSFAGNTTDSRLNIGGNFNLLMGNRTNILNFLIDDDGQLNVTGDLDIDFSGNEYVYIDLNQNVAGTADNAQLNVGGDFTIDKSDGDQFRLFLEDDADVDVEGDLIINNTAHDAAGQHDEIQIEDDALIDVEGDFTFTLNSTGFNDNDMIIDMNQNGAMEVGVDNGALTKSMTLNFTQGDDLIWDLDNSATTTVYGDLNIVKTAGDEVEIELNENAGTDAEIHVYGDLDLDNVENADLIYFQLDESASLLDVNGDIDFRGAATAGRIWIDLESTSKVELGGDILRNPAPNKFGLISSEAGTTIEFNGTGSQIIPDETGSGTDSIGYANIIINNSAPTKPQFTLENHVTWRSNTDFSNGIIETSSTSLILFEDDATTNGGSLSSYIEGPTRKKGNDIFEFPVGDSAIWSRLAISAPFNASTVFEAQYFRGNAHLVPYDTNAKQPSIFNVSGKDWWMLNKISGASDSVFVTLHWENADTNKINDLADLKVVRWDSDSLKWIDYKQSATTGGADSLDSGSVTSSIRIQKFSPFTFGSGSSLVNPLPITLLSFSAVATGDIVSITWTTLEEINNDYFEIERSLDGKNFYQIEKLPGAGNYSGELNYSTIDPEPIVNRYSYYRLSQTDYNGTKTYSKIDAVFISKSTDAIEPIVFPNPVLESEVFVHFLPFKDLTTTCYIYDIQGRMVSEQKLPATGDGLLTIEVPKLEGLYILKVFSGNDSFTEKILVK